MKGFLFIFFLLPLSALANEKLDESLAYQEVLKRHLREGHISEEDAKKQRYYYEKDKEWRSEFGEKIRGIASSLKSPRDIIELENPAIEIPVE